MNVMRLATRGARPVILGCRSYQPQSSGNSTQWQRQEPTRDFSTGNVYLDVTIVVGSGIGAASSIPTVLSVAGFTEAGIAAASLGANLMSVSAIYNGGGVAAGGIVAGLQSAGVLGTSASTQAVVALGVSAVTAITGYFF
ncbi:interferon alpha-inducible protein 27-like protein 2A [Ylistrum balloti]|uniref:interferon alpha-inducible protein 27-like protein 2A n=1 Tax=Ylistrum balloti TaxID=509963 RepID=UPI002905DCCA|nr:interferon alpha-inducible protein 27-like protein 2A [Ylistrum balloti]